MTAKIWAITTYFNPMCFSSRKRNFDIFRANLTLPLLVVELSNNDDYELRDCDAERIIRVKSSSVLWQKERLLNIAIDNLPEDVQYVAWLDCDIIFENLNWHEQAVEALARCNLLQLFTTLVDLRENEYTPNLVVDCNSSDGKSIVHLLSTNSQTEQDLRPKSTAHMRTACYGLAWASSVSLLKAYRFYDSMVMGSGDRALICAAFNIPDAAISTLHLNEVRKQHYLLWAQKFQLGVDKKIACLDGRIFHLWHGKIENRKYAERHRDFSYFNFDPNIDVFMSSSGAYEWESSRTDLNTFATKYFENRKEDGDCPLLKQGIGNEYLF